ncbi:hypothetical protein YTPLAS18_39380 [Nitrospira sp.]|nr:hypothetical protein YTPLAS18_39380 [Nitrospira sp.]
MIPTPPPHGRLSYDFRKAVRLLLLTSLHLSGCVALEFDRMTGTTFPPQHMVNGQPVTLESIYDDAGISLEVEEDETTIVPLNIANNDCISDAELDALENGHRHLSLFPSSACGLAICNTYHLYGVVVDHYGEVLDACIPEFVLGKMWQSHTRSAFAIFYAMNTLQTDGPAYLRTTAHEAGHGFNLHHSDGDGTSIMTQTDDLTGDPVYAFSPQSNEHLDTHPAPCKFPGAVGGAPFTWVSNAHAAWLHPSEDLTVSDCE